MELLGLEPGTSATERLDHLTSGPLPDHVVRALVAATGMTANQARALTTPHTTLPDHEAVRRMTEADFASGYYRGASASAGAGKTSTRGPVVAAVALALAQRAGMIAPDSQPTVDQPGWNPDLEDLARRLLADKHATRGGAGKTCTDARDLARRLAE
ncbi:hypothetical protein [Streptomyces chartreusis]